MKNFIKNSYFFIIFIMILITKNFFYGFFIPKTNCNDMYITYLEKEIENINLIKNYSYKDKFTMGKVINQNIYKFKEEIKVACDTKNIEINDLVINDDYLVGKVKKVYKNFIIVSLITGKDFTMQVLANDEYGIINNIEGTLILTGVNNLLNPSDIVYVSPLSGYKELIKVGYVLKKNNRVDNNYEIISYKDRYDYVFILSKDKI